MESFRGEIRRGNRLYCRTGETDWVLLAVDWGEGGESNGRESARVLLDEVRERKKSVKQVHSLRHRWRGRTCARGKHSV